MEIEIKAKLRDKAAVMQKLTALGCEFSEPKTQDDMVWVKNMGDLPTFLGNDVFLRIRVEGDGKTILTAKKPKNIAGEGNLVKREHEVVVDSAEEARAILEMLGLKEAVRTIKTRQKAKHGGYEICIDEVEGLGSFIEVEKIADEKDTDKILEEMMEFLAPLGVTVEDKVTKGYDILMIEKNGL